MFICKLTQTIELLALKSDLFYGILSLYYEQLVKNELDLAKINQKDKVLCIGGGNCPMTAILINKYTGAKVTVIDNNLSCVENSRKLLEKRNLNNITVKCSDCKHINTCQYSVIHMAMQVSPMQESFKKLFASANANTRILVRNPKSILKSMYCKINDSPLKAQIVKHGCFVNAGSTSLFSK